MKASLIWTAGSTDTSRDRPRDRPVRCAHRRPLDRPLVLAAGGHADRPGARDAANLVSAAVKVAAE